MLMRHSLRSLYKSYHRKVQHSIAQLKVLDVQDNYLYVVEDYDKKLSYLREIETVQGERGIVLKLDEQCRTYVAMYRINPQFYTTLEIAHHDLPWQQSYEPIYESLLAGEMNKMFSVEGKTLYALQTSQTTAPYKRQDRRLLTLSPLLDVCNNLNYGDMITFVGCRGSHKTTELEKILGEFGLQHNHLGLYLNTHSESQAKRICHKTNCVSFNNESGQSDAGVYMQAVKTINLANNLKRAGRNVLLGIDNFKDILQAEWHMLQLLQGSNLDIKKKAGDTINYNSLKLSPISILNEVYSGCVDHTKNPPIVNKKIKGGSFTSIIATENEHQLAQMPEMTPYSNNLKHLLSLSKNIQFPLDINSNKTMDRSIDSDLHIVKQHLKDYLQQKISYEMRLQLYKTDTKESPWDYYHILDADWWINGIKTFHPTSQQQNQQFLKWIALNLQRQITSQWKISAVESFHLFESYEQRTQSNSIEEFINWARLQGHFSVFKKDYIH